MPENIFEQANSLISPFIIESFFPGGEWIKLEYYITNPLRADNEPGSFSISEQGLYFDFATQQKGNFIQLISETQHITLKAAAELIIKTAGVMPHESAPPKK